MNDYSFALQLFGGPAVVRRGVTAVTCRAFVREASAQERANDADRAPAIFVLQFDEVRSIGGIAKYDKIEAHGKVYSVMDARVMYEGANPVLVKGACVA